MNPYRGSMPPGWPESMALVIRGHVVRADSHEEMIGKLRLLGDAIGFTLRVTSAQSFTITFAGDDPTAVHGAPACLPN